MKKVIVYYPFKTREQTSGSAVRPAKLLEAFYEAGRKHLFEVVPIIGETHERKEKLESFYKNTKPEDVLFCYMENATIPYWLTDSNHIPKHPLMDIKFFSFLKKNNIPLGIFYRDIYWKFDEFYPLTGPKRAIMRTIFKMELSVYKKYADVIFLPSPYMNKYVGIDSQPVISLPPGGVDKVLPTVPNNEPIQAVYVGGINQRYGIYDVLEAFDTMNKDELKIKLILVCREAEFKVMKEHFTPYVNQPWLKLMHAHGEQLAQIYKEADFGIVPIKKDTYNNFAVAVKQFEYISYGLPIIATNCDAQRDLVESGNYGIIVDDNPASIKEGLEKMLDQDTRQQLRNNAVHALRTENLWLHRAETIIEELSRD
ncbi:glycosyltransferase [Fictibacillus sp. 7GRE50]|uniref:glycosyltransferase n=1 Tax=Fictibacillus sp. 7GRE50 TaxID=2745878 RepID=UPI0018CF28DE|nr:glycosyltransferase [Fictibacillus sp. 7GRE50]MBH0164080.1 glycosyltransferase [Fictibacillus sp. 7GRE50]